MSAENHPDSGQTANPQGGAATTLTGALVNESLVKWHIIAALFWFGIALFAGLFYSMQLIKHWPLPLIPVLSPGRIRMIHTNLIAFGFLTNAFFGMLCWTVPRLTGKKIASNFLGYAIFGAWNLIILLTYIGLHMGEAQAVEWGETPVWVDPLVVVGAVLVAIQFYTPIIRTTERAMYVSLWYFSAAFVWLGLTYIMGNFFPQYLVAGNAAGPLLGLYIHDLVGLWVTPMGWGMMYFFVPIIMKRPIWSHALSLVGFWGLAFFYPLQGVHHFLGSPIPMFAQYSAVVSTIAIEIVVTTVIINFFTTWKNGNTSIGNNIALRWFWLGAFNYALTCFQCSLQVTLTFQQVIHFTDWVVGHAHLVMFGVFSFWIFGMIDHLWPKLTGREWYSRALREWHFWLMGMGLAVMFLTLTAAGMIDGFMALNLVPRETILNAMQPFWFVRTFTGVAIIAGFLCQTANMYLTARAGRVTHIDTDYAPYEELEQETTVGTV
ncbi:MAG: cbb3-type cytochrome c oxidase subunit I [Planctomycetes bacterium]|nr:cbb3-type cytochrome c oxidase subunit I [Planctomycetota bacterium]